MQHIKTHQVTSNMQHTTNDDKEDTKHMRHTTLLLDVAQSIYEAPSVWPVTRFPNFRPNLA